MGFKDDFVWGTSTASYQIEGAAYEDGKGLQIWDVFCKEKDGKVYENQTGDVACDQYHRYKEDVKIMKDLGIKAYRFSISWARLIPDGIGEINEKGIEYYNNLIDELVANDIEPYVTLYHWDLPYALHLKGGWLNPEITEWFFEYVKLIAERFTDRVTHFFTLNEPQCTISHGYYTGIMAPGLKVGKKDYLQAWHNILKAHGRAVQALRQYSVQPVKIGIASCGATYYPESDSPEDIEAARKATFGVMIEDVNEWAWSIGFVCDPIYKGEYPKEFLENYKDYLPEITREDMELISQPLDFHAQNIYNAVQVRAGKDGKVERVKRYDGFPRTAFYWPVTPESLYWPVKFLAERYQVPVYVSENGMSSHDWVSLDGKVHDSSRVDFMHRYLLELKKLVESGIDVAGYFVWSLLDDFEWGSGYSERFGLVHVDFQTLQRTIKDSGYWYQEVIATNGENL